MTELLVISVNVISNTSIFPLSLSRYRLNTTETKSLVPFSLWATFPPRVKAKPVAESSDYITTLTLVKWSFCVHETLFTM